MKIDIPILIVLLNDTELNIYKNKIFINYFINYLKSNSIYDNCVFIYSGEENQILLEELGVTNTFYTSLYRISHETEYQAIWEYLEETNNQCDWFINLDPINYDPTTIYSSITNIDNHYDFIFFKSEIADLSDYELDSNNKRMYEFEYNDKIKTIVNTSLFITKTSFFKKCYRKANKDPKMFGLYFWQGKYKALEDNGSFEIRLVNKQQINNFINLMNQIKKSSI